MRDTLGLVRRAFTVAFAVLMLMPVAVSAQEAAEDAGAQVREPDYAGIDIRLIPKPELLEPVRTLTAANLDQDGFVIDQDDWLGDAASVVVDPGLGNVTFSHGLDLPGSLAICEGSSCEVLGDVSLGQALTSLSDLSVGNNLTTADEIDLGADLHVGGDVASLTNINVDGKLYVGGSVSCKLLSCGDDMTISSALEVSGGVFCQGRLKVDGDISCGIGDLQVCRDLECDGNVTSQGFIFVAWGPMIVGGDIKCRTDCVAGCGIEAGGTINAGGRIMVGANPGYKVKDDSVKCTRIIRGTIVVPEPPAANASGGPLASAFYEEVPAGNWSYRALDYMCKEGILTGYPEGFFRVPTGAERGETGSAPGQDEAESESSNRRILKKYEFAQAVNRLLDEIEYAEEPIPEQVQVIAEALEAEYDDLLREISH